MAAASTATASTYLRSTHATSTRRLTKGQTVVKWMTTTDHKVIGNLYFISSFAKPANSGVANISSMIVPCIVKSWLN